MAFFNPQNRNILRVNNLTVLYIVVYHIFMDCVKALTKNPKDSTPKYVLKVENVAVLLGSGETVSSIAKLYKVSIPAVSQFIARNADRLSELANFDAIMSSRLKNKALSLLDKITPEDISRANLLQKATSTAIMIDKSRLLDNKSTQNVSLAHHIDLSNFE